MCVGMGKGMGGTWKVCIEGRCGVSIFNDDWRNAR